MGKRVGFSSGRPTNSDARQTRKITYNGQLVDRFGPVSRSSLDKHLRPWTRPKPSPKLVSCAAQVQHQQHRFLRQRCRPFLLHRNLPYIYTTVRLRAQGRVRNSEVSQRSHMSSKQRIGSTSPQRAMPEFNSQEMRDATNAPPNSHDLPPPPPSDHVPNSEGSVAPSSSSRRHRNLLRETWLDQTREQFDDLSTGLKDRILNFINEHHPGKPTGENRWYYGSYNLSIACNFYDESAGISVSLTPQIQTPEVTCKIRLEALGVGESHASMH